MDTNTTPPPAPQADPVDAGKYADVRTSYADLIDPMSGRIAGEWSL
jgi:hypothetical protein